jgi:hypothetical protein
VGAAIDRRAGDTGGAFDNLCDSAELFGLNNPRSLSLRVLDFRPMDKKNPPDLGILRLDEAVEAVEKDVLMGGAEGRSGILAKEGYGRAGPGAWGTSESFTPRSVARYASARIRKVALDRTDASETTRC